MSIASEITRLSGVRADIFTSITNKGVTVPATATFSSCPALIDSITGGGGGGDPTSLINSTFTASGKLSGYREFTATQNTTTSYSYDDVSSGLGTTGYQNEIAYIGFPLDYLTGTSGQNGVWSVVYFQLENASDSPSQVYLIPQYSYNWQEGVQIGYLNSLGNNTYEFVKSWNTIYEAYQSKSSEWQWNIQNNTIYIALRSPWYQANTYTISNGEITGRVVTGETTAYVYPDYPTTTTGYVQNVIDLKESWNENQYYQYRALLSAHNTKNVVYDNSPSNTAITSNSTAYTDTFSASMLKNKWSLDLGAVDTNYTYSYGTSASGYSGFEGV